MVNTETKGNRLWQGVKRDLVAWSLKYEKFREELLRDPKGMVEKELGEKLPDFFEVLVREESDTCLVVVIPPNPRPGPSAEDADLGDVARWYASTRTAALIARAWADAAFKAKLVSDPRAAISGELGLELPAEVEVEVIEESTGRLCIVLPASVDEAQAGELSDEELLTLAAPMVAGSPQQLTSFFAC